jgi:hypothetical protein
MSIGTMVIELKLHVHEFNDKKKNIDKMGKTILYIVPSLLSTCTQAQTIIAHTLLYSECVELDGIVHVPFPTFSN